MGKYIAKRVWMMLITFLIITFFLYVVYCLVPGNPVMYRYVDPDVEETKWQYFSGMVDTIVSNYCDWMGLTKGPDGIRSGVLQGDFGESSYYGRTSIAVLKPRLINTLCLNTVAALITLAITIPLGIFCAVHYKKPADAMIQTVTLVGYSIPSYLIALLAIFLFAVVLGLFPAGGSKTPGLLVKGLPMLIDRLYYMFLPTICLVFTGMASMTRIVRAAMIDTLSQDYIKTARAKGLKEKVVIYSHAWANALLPISNSLCRWVVGIFTGGSLVIETTFSLVGTGTLFWDALTHSDFQMALCLEVFYTAASLVGNLLTDLFYTLADPRVRLDR